MTDWNKFWDEGWRLWKLYYKSKTSMFGDYLRIIAKNETDAMKLAQEMLPEEAFDEGYEDIKSAGFELEAVADNYDSWIKIQSSNRTVKT